MTAQLGDIWAYKCSCDKIIRILYTVQRDEHVLHISHGQHRAVTVVLNYFPEESAETLARNIVYALNWWFGEKRKEGCSWIPKYGVSPALPAPTL